MNDKVYRCHMCYANHHNKQMVVPVMIFKGFGHGSELVRKYRCKDCDDKINK